MTVLECQFMVIIYGNHRSLTFLLRKQYEFPFGINIVHFFLFQLMKNLHQKCYLVHADLSAYNLLWHAGTVHVIDVSQAVDLTHPQAYNFLYRDCMNISNVRHFGYFSEYPIRIIHA